MNHKVVILQYNKQSVTPDDAMKVQAELEKNHYVVILAPTVGDAPSYELINVPHA